MVKQLGFYVFALLCILIGLYPLMYVFVENPPGLLESKDQVFLESRLWYTAFYMHILWGGLALLVGWSQFSSKLRRKRLKLHRKLGIIYTISVLFSGLAGVYLGIYATGGLISSLGFILLGLIWLSSTGIAFRAILKKNIQKHQKWMIISYAACFAAVTLRIWLPMLMSIFGEFLIAYRIVAWLCWVPNIIVALIIINRLKLNMRTA